jgi:hypothetical protein
MKITLNQQEINEKLAIIDGYVINPNYTRKMYQHVETGKLVEADDFKYHSSWDCLIPIFHKLKKYNIHEWFSELSNIGSMFLLGCTLNEIDKSYQAISKLISLPGFEALYWWYTCSEERRVELLHLYFCEGQSDCVTKHIKPLELHKHEIIDIYIKYKK